MKRAIDITLAPTQALDLVEASFEAAPTATERDDADGGWTSERTEDRLLAYPTDPLAHLLEPEPDEYIPWEIPETLALVVDAVRVGERTRITARIARRRVFEVVAHLTADVILLPLIAVLGGGRLRIFHAVAMLELRPNRRAAKDRMLRIAITPLLAHQPVPNRGPFRT